MPRSRPTGIATTALLILAFLTVSPASPARAADLIIANGGFDDGLTGWSGSHSPGGVTAVTWQGRTSAQIADTDATKAYGRESMPSLPAAAGTRYAVFAKVWAESGSADLYLRFRDDTGALLSSAYTHVTATGQWTDVRAAATAPAGATRVSALIYSGVANVGTAYWDDIRVSAAVTNLGVQLESDVPNGTAFDAAGGTVYAVYTGTEARNPRLAVIDVAGETVTRKIELPDSAASPTVGGWAATVATDGSVYLGTYPNSKLYRYVPGQTTVSDLGRAEGGYSFIWDIEPGSGGEIYGGTYNDARYFRYQNGAFTTMGAVPIRPGKENVRSIAHDPVANATYLGLGTNAGLVRYDNATGRTDDLLPAAYANESMVGDLTWTGDRLFAWLNRTLLVLHVVRNADGSYRGDVDAVIGDAELHVSPARDGKVWFVKDEVLQSYDIAGRTVSATSARPGMDVTGYGWAGNTLVALGGAPTGTKVFKYTPATGQWTSRGVSSVPILPAAINALGTGPDGKIYTGGYLTGGTGVYDPLHGDADDNTPDTPTLTGLHQTDSLLAAGSKLYIGVYPSAKLYEYDPTRAWNPGTNPVLRYTGGAAGDIADDCGAGQGPPPQDRPYALAAAPDGTVYMGSVPKYGKRSGALSIWKAGTQGRTLCVVPGQAVVSLAYQGGKVYGGTSARGALGVNPVFPPGAQSTLFAYDPATGGVTTYPLPAAVTNRLAITDVTAVDGDIWGFAEGWLFVFDPGTGRYTTATQLFPGIDYKADPTHAWRDANLTTVPWDTGHVYGSIGDQIFRIDKSTKALTVLHTEKGMDGLAADADGNLYYKIGETLRRYVP
ncbi:carbohydrate binding domain-containing protein [Microbispora sp. KK1-11]|uniref:carbohydrate binding domain-containing protein n=1 Tax=Microbispora sp. KK1-11 TaxID=2053005 RepID=UPI00163BFD8E|nr:carbohydrate binding domain-containing protein [Microbispora sp. KK1-11]